MVEECTLISSEDEGSINCAEKENQLYASEGDGVDLVSSKESGEKLNVEDGGSLKKEAYEEGGDSVLSETGGGGYKTTPTAAEEGGGEQAVPAVETRESEYEVKTVKVYGRRKKSEKPREGNGEKKGSNEKESQLKD